jgi:Basic tilted helix bundle domain
MISFVFLSDGPCDSASWRPAKDESMHWARRDALVRISSLSLWQAAGVASSACDDSSFLFHDEIKDSSKHARAQAGSPSNLKGNIAVISMYGPELVSMVRVPTEQALIRCFKESSASALRVPKKAIVGQSNAYAACVCSFTPWQETAFLPFENQTRIAQPVDSVTSSSGSFPIAMSRSSSSTGGCASTTVTTSISTSISVSADFDKRVVVKALQKQCPLEFLRKHGLNGSEDMVLKKRNKAAILTAYNDWICIQQQNQQSSSASTCNDSGLASTNKNIAMSASYTTNVNGTKSDDCGSGS